jgi:hypothetical protein
VSNTGPQRKAAYGAVRSAHANVLSAVDVLGTYLDASQRHNSEAQQREKLYQAASIVEDVQDWLEKQPDDPDMVGG